MPYKRTYADRILLIRPDVGEGALHFEFQSTVDGDIGLRMLHYGLNHMVSANTVRTRNTEIYELPHSVIIDVKPGIHNSDNGVRTVQLKHNGNTVSLRFPVVSLEDRLPWFYELATQTIVDEQTRVCVSSIFNEYPPSSGNEITELEKICSLFVAGAEDPDATEYDFERVTDIMGNVKDFGENMFDRARREGREEGREEGRKEGREEMAYAAAKALADATGISLEEAKKRMLEQITGGTVKRMKFDQQT